MECKYAQKHQNGPNCRSKSLPRASSRAAMEEARIPADLSGFVVVIPLQLNREVDGILLTSRPARLFPSGGRVFLLYFEY